MTATLFVIVSCLTAMLAFADSTRAAEPVRVGEIGVNVNQLACTCTAFQSQELSGAPSYRFPFNGVITQYDLRVGVAPSQPEFVRVRSFRKGSGNNATVISQGVDRSIPNASAGNVASMFDRVPVAANDMLGGKWDTSPNVNYTSFRFQASNPADGVSDLSSATTVNPGVEHDYLAASSPQRLNMQAVLEPDLDGDQFGDDSQDLCPGDSTRHAAPCTGTALGSQIPSGTMASTGACVDYLCTVVQRNVAGASTAAPFDGVVVRWRIRAAVNITTKLRVVRPTVGFGVVMERSSEPVSIVVDPSYRGRIVTIPTRLPISAGSFVGIQKPPSVNLGAVSGAGAGSSFSSITDVGDGEASGFSVLFTNEFAYGADIEPDVDHDGFGDLTQDSCPSNGTVQLACTTPAAAPAITGLKFKHSKFRVKKKGAVIKTSKSNAGTSFALTLSQAASVKFQLASKLKGKRSGSKCVKRTATNSKKKNCTYLRNVFAFQRALTVGKSSIAFSGRYQRGKKNVALKPGNYRLVAIPSNASGGVGKASTTDVRVVTR
jgi:hypothetical protein